MVLYDDIDTMQKMREDNGLELVVFFITVKVQLQPFFLLPGIVAFLAVNMAFTMPSFLTRFFRPFTTSMMRPLQPDSLAAQTFEGPNERAIFAGGCFWGLEEMYRKHWGQGKGLLDCRVGYTGGQTENPTYRQVCDKKTGHAEALLIIFNPEKVSYPQLVEYFFKMHDPTTPNQQGPDVGPQYRSAVFAVNDDQLRIAEEIKDKVGKQWYPGSSISTEVAKATQWYDAEPLHQDYLGKRPDGYQCPAHYVRTKFPPLSDD